MPDIARTSAVLFSRNGTAAAFNGKRLPAHCCHIHARRASRTARFSERTRHGCDPVLRLESSMGARKSRFRRGTNSSQVQADTGFGIIFNRCDRIPANRPTRNVETVNAPGWLGVRWFGRFRSS